MAGRKDASELKGILNDNLEDVVQKLIPTGRRDHGEWVAGSPAGDPGGSYRIVLDGPNRGLVKEFAGDLKGGDVFSLIQDVLTAKTGQKVGFRGALAWAEEYLTERGLISPETVEPRASTQRPQDLTWIFGDERPEKLKLAPLSDSTAEYLASRGISRKTAEEYGVCDGELYGRKKIVFPYYWEGVVDEEGNPKPVFAKARNFENKSFFTTKKDESFCVPFGAHMISPEARSLGAVEGEFDCLACAEAGLRTVSLPMGAGGKANWIDNGWNWLCRFEKIILALDNDGAGRQGVEWLIRRLGSHRCWIAQWPDGIKDANEALQKGVDIQAVFAAAKRYCPPDLKLATEFGKSALDKLLTYIKASEDQKKQLLVGEMFPWQTPDQPIRMVPGHVTLWVGAEGSAKSKAALQNVGWSMTNGAKWCVASLEMPPEEFLMHFERQMLGEEDYIKVESGEGEERVAEIMPKILSQMTVYIRPEKESCSMDRILSAAEFSMRRYGTDHLLIDNFTNLNIDLDDYNGQKKAMDMAHDFAMDTQMHVHIVCHSRKNVASTKGGTFPLAPPTNDDIFGSRSISALAQNIVALWRNFPKEQFFERLAKEGLTDKNGRPDLRRYPDEKQYKADSELYNAYIKAPDEVIRTNKWRGDGFAESKMITFFLKWSNICKRFELIDNPDFYSYLTRFERVRKSAGNEDSGKE